MKKATRKIGSIALSVIMIVLMLVPGLTAFAAGTSITITDKNGNEITERIEVQEYGNVQLSYTVSPEMPDGSYVEWESNLPLLADVDENGKVTGYDYSKAAIIQLWLDEEVRTIPVVGESTAKAIENAITNSGYDLETVNTDLLVALIKGVAGDSIGDSLKNYLDNMNVEITATLYSADGVKISSDMIEVLVTQSIIAQVVPTGVHITNRKKVPTVVAVGKQIQLYAAVTPVRVAKQQNITEYTWSAEKTKLIGGGDVCATVDSDGLVTFTGVGEVKIVVRPKGAQYLAFSTSMTFTVVDPSELPLTSFEISGELSVTEGETTQLSINNIDPPGAYTGDIVWTSSDPTIAVVDNNGIVTGLDGGTLNKKVDITATIGDISRTVNVTVKRGSLQGSITGVDINGTDALGAGETEKYTATVYPSKLNTNNSVVREWGIVDDNGDRIFATSVTPAANAYGTIDKNGNFTALSNGVVTIFVKASFNNSEYERTKSIFIGKAITDFEISGNLTIDENKTTELSIVNITPDDYDEEILDTIKWTSSDPKIAAVDQNGLVRGIEGGSNLINDRNRYADITATIGGVSKTVTVTVRRPTQITDKFTEAYIDGVDTVIKDIPYKFEGSFSPSRVSVANTYWGVVGPDGQQPFDDSNSVSGPRYSENDYVRIAEDGTVYALDSGETDIYVFATHKAGIGVASGVTSHVQTSKHISTVEIEPKSISVTAPTKTVYVEGETELDLTGLVVSLTYDRADVEQYYGDTSEKYTDSDLVSEVTDYQVGAINPKILDTEQYIVLTVTRAGKSYRGVFAITLESKDLESINLINPKYKYLEGETELDLTGLEVRANYTNAASEMVTDFVVNTNDFNPELFNVEQNITVSYTHEGRSASATFPVIVYGLPVVSVDTDGYDGSWTDGNITYTLDSTNKLDGITYYYKTESIDWTELAGNTLTVDTNCDETYYFKAINSEGIESNVTDGFTAKRDNVKPSFSLEKENELITNESYKININNILTGASGVKSITLNGVEITDNFFTVDENGEYEVVITANNGLFEIHSITVDNIDKLAPVVNEIVLKHKNDGGFARFINSITFGLFFNEKVEITIDSEDIGVAGIDTVEYRLLDENGAPVTAEWSVYDDGDKPVIDPAFKGYVQARATDKAGNISEYVCSDGFVIDGDKPTDVVIDAKFGSDPYTDGKWVSDSVEITLSSTAYSGIFKYLYRIDGGDWTQAVNGKLTASVEGAHLYEFMAVSNAALDSDVSSITVKIDRQTPVIRVDFKGTFGRWTSDDVTFSLTTLEESISDITYYYTDGNGEWIEIATGDVITLNSNTNANYQFKAVNAAGTESNVSDSYYVMIDKVAPSINFTPEVTENTIDPYSVAFDVSCGNAGLESVTLNGTDITGESEFAVSENGSYILVATGKNGKTTVKTFTVNNFVELDLKIKSITFEAKNAEDYKGKNENDPYGMYFSGPVSATIELECNLDNKYTTIGYKLVDEKTGAGSLVYLPSKNTKTITVDLDEDFKGSIEAVAYMSNDPLTNGNNIKTSEPFTSQGITIDTATPTTPVVAVTVDGEAYNGQWLSKNADITLASSAPSGIKEYLYSVDGGEYVALISNTLVADKDGNHIYSFKSVSNTGIESDAVNTTVKLEKAAPMLSVSVEGMIGQKTGDDVSFTLSSPNALSKVTYSYNDGNGWTVMDGNNLTLTESTTAAYTFKAVNEAGVESEISPAYNVNIDKTFQVVEKKPILKVGVTGELGAYTVNDVTFTLSSTDANGEVKYYYNDGTGFKAINGNVLVINSSTNKTYTFKAVDSLGKQSDISEEYLVMIDKVIPTVSLKTSAQITPNAPITVDINTITGASGIALITVNGADVTTAESFTVSDNGTYTVKAYAGNGLACEKVISFNEFDFAKPVITDISVNQKNGGAFAKVINTLTFGIFMNEAAEITISAVDDGSAGVKSIEYRYVDENGVATEWATYSDDAKPTVEGQFKGLVQARAIDNCNNISDIAASDGFVVDMKTPSEVVITATTEDGVYNGEYTNKSVTLKLSSTAFSDICEYKYSIDSREWATLSSDTLTALEGVHRYEFKAVSNAGKESDPAQITVKIETGKPELTVIKSGELNSAVNKTVTFILSATNIASGVTYYYNDGTGFKALDTNVFTADLSTKKTYTFKAVNNAGSESDVSEQYEVIIDKTDLVNALESVNTLDKDEYTGESVNVLETAIENGNKVLNNANASVADVQNAVKAINEAVNALEDAYTGYPDVFENDWYYNAVKFASRKGYFHGYGNGNFGPGDNIQRQDFVVVLANIAGADLTEYQGKNGGFSDVQKGTYFAAAVAWAVEKGIITGYGGTTRFGVGDPITREQVCAIFYRYVVNYCNGDATLSTSAQNILAKYKDKGSISDWATGNVAWAVDKGVISGTSSTTVTPLGNANRAQIAQILMNMSGKGMI